MKHFILAAALACSASMASATTLDFETGTTNFDNTIAFDGFSFSFGSAGWFIGDPANAFYPNGVTNGTGILVADGDRDGATATVTMTQDGGGTFDLFALLASSSSLLVDNTLEIVGNLFGGGTVSTSVAVGNSFAGFNLVGFENLTSVVFSSVNSGGFGQGAGFALDDLQLDPTVAPIPVPATLPLLLLGLGGIGLIRRARAA